MATMTLNSYLHHIYGGWERYDGERIGELLSLADSHVMSSRLFEDGYTQKIKDDLTSPLSDMVILHFQVLTHIRKGKLDQALQSQCQLGQTFCRVFAGQKEGGNWGLPLMEKLCEDLRRVALSATLEEDLLSTSEENAPTSMERAADVIMALFRVCAADTRPQEETKRWGMLVLVNHLFKIYFRINRLQLCKPLIRAIEAQAIKDRFPPSQIVTYKYYVGRKAMFDSEFKQADECLSYAFQNCSSTPSPRSGSGRGGNKKKILMYLIPVKMFLGWLPTKEALLKYELTEFMEISQALKDGNIGGFDAGLKANAKTFIKAGVYLILEKLRMLLYRNLLKKVCLIHSNHQIPMGAFEVALKWAGHEEVDLDETHCILANLIYDNRIRGYISQQHQMLVLAKTNPFPKISLLSPDT